MDLIVESFSKAFLSRDCIVKLDFDHSGSFERRSKIGNAIFGYSLPPINNLDLCNPRFDSFLSEKGNYFDQFQIEKPIFMFLPMVTKGESRLTS